MIFKFLLTIWKQAQLNDKQFVFTAQVVLQGRSSFMWLLWWSSLCSRLLETKDKFLFKWSGTQTMEELQCPLSHFLLLIFSIGVAK